MSKETQVKDRFIAALERVVTQVESGSLPKCDSPNCKECGKDKTYTPGLGWRTE